MFNLPTGGELVIILLVALVVLGPDKLPDAVRKAGRLYGEVRRMANGFQAELRDALDEPKGALNELKEPLEGLRTTLTDARSTFLAGATEPVLAPGAVVDQGRQDTDVELPDEPLGEGADADGDDGLVELGEVALPVAAVETADADAPGPGASDEDRD